MMIVRKIFGILLLAVAGILVASVIITFEQLARYFNLLFMCLTEGCNGDTFKNLFFGLLTYFFMGFMVFYLGRRGYVMLMDIKPEEAEPSPILDEADFSHSEEAITCFQTKYGYCHVLPDRIIFAATKTLEDLSAYKERNKIIGATTVQVLVIAAATFYIYRHAGKGDFWKLLAPVLVVLFLLISFLTSLRNSTTQLIPREKILSVKFVKGIAYLVTPHFIIWFTDHNNRKRKRVVILAGYSEKAISEALRVFRNASLTVVE